MDRTRQRGIECEDHLTSALQDNAGRAAWFDSNAFGPACLSGIVRLEATPELSSMAFKNRNEVEAYVEGALRQATTDGWAFERSDSTRLWWTIKRVSIPPGEWFCQDYHLHVTEDWQWFILTYGNNDIGPGSLDQELQCARVISARSSAVYSLSDCIRYVITHCEPNEWGYT